MRLKDVIADYEANRRGEDYLSAYYTDEKGRREPVDLATLKARHPEAYALMLEADIARHSIEPNEGCYWDGPSFKLNIWSAEIDADQAQIALGTHPALRERRKRR